MYKNILLAVDGSNYTDSILETGIRIAKAFNSYIHVLTIADVRIFEWATTVGADGFVPIIPSGAYQEESKKILDEKCVKILEKCSALLKKEKLKFQTEQVIGTPADIILEKSHTVDLTIMGKRGEFANWDKKTLGATTDSVSRGTFKPLLVVEKPAKEFKKILVGYDGSRNANQMLMYAGHFAEGLKSKLKVVCVCNDRAVAEKNCNEAKKYLKSYDIELTDEIISGHPEEEIVKLAQAEFDLIAIGAYGNSRIKEAILGSTTEHILRFSENSVLLAK